MANILGDDKKQQILALGRLGWPLRRIEQATGVRRETASVYLKTAGIAIRAPRRRRLPPKPASPVSTDPANPAREVRPPMAHCHLGLGRLYQRTGDAERADAHLTTARTLYGERPAPTAPAAAAAAEFGPDGG
jgi:hypothetical protein